jgi:hypothetical protein
VAATADGALRSWLVSGRADEPQSLRFVAAKAAPLADGSVDVLVESLAGSARGGVPRQVAPVQTSTSAGHRAEAARAGDDGGGGGAPQLEGTSGAGSARSALGATDTASSDAFPFSSMGNEDPRRCPAVTAVALAPPVVDGALLPSVPVRVRGALAAELSAVSALGVWGEADGTLVWFDALLGAPLVVQDALAAGADVDGDPAAGVPSGIVALAWAASTGRVVAAAVDGRVAVCAADGDVLGVVVTGEAVRCLALAPGSAGLAAFTGGSHGVVRVWDLRVASGVMPRAAHTALARERSSLAAWLAETGPSAVPPPPDPAVGLLLERLPSLRSIPEDGEFDDPWAPKLARLAAEREAERTAPPPVPLVPRREALVWTLVPERAWRGGGADSAARAATGPAEPAARAWRAASAAVVDGSRAAPTPSAEGVVPTLHSSSASPAPTASPSADAWCLSGEDSDPDVEGASSWVRGGPASPPRARSHPHPPLPHVRRCRRCH